MRHQKVKSMRTPSKSKKSEKLGKLLVRNANGTGRPDLSSLRKPIDTSVSDLRQVSGLLEDGTDEVKSILTYECNVIYECRVCHSLFRSIVNLVSHKREYCQEKFDIALGRRVFNNYNMVGGAYESACVLLPLCVCHSLCAYDDGGFFFLALFQRVGNTHV